MMSLLRVFKFAFQNIYRNIGLSFMTVVTLVLMLLAVNTLFVVRVFTSEAVSAVKDQIDVSIYFHHDATEEHVVEIREYIEGFPEVVGSTFMSAEDVLDDFREKHVGRTEVLQALQELGENPFGPTLIVKTREPGDYEKLITALQVPEYEHVIEAKTFGDTQTAIRRIDQITSNLEYFVAFLALLFATIAFIVIFNTIRVAIYSQREEIAIKKLVGATNWFVRAPYIINAVVFSLVSTALAYAAAWFAADVMDPYITIVFGKMGVLTSHYSSNILMLAGVQFGVVLLLTVCTTGIAMRRYLRV